MNFLAQAKAYIGSLVENGGPAESDDAAFLACIDELARVVRENPLPSAKVDFREWFGPALSPATMQGLALQKPRGYAGDFEIIDRIYLRHTTPDVALANWDHFYHRQAAPKAVRNRKAYFHGLLDRHAARCRPLRVLKLASGPGRCMFEWFGENPGAQVCIDCVDIDAEAIAYAKALNGAYSDRISFARANALRYRPRKSYDLIWAAGLFDYFNDGLFSAMLVRFLPALAKGGELVIGNFGDFNPSRNYMELLGAWQLHHRSESHLRALGRAAGVPEQCIRVGCEPEGVNLFLHLDFSRSPR